MAKNADYEHSVSSGQGCTSRTEIQSVSRTTEEISPFRPQFCSQQRAASFNPQIRPARNRMPVSAVRGAMIAPPPRPQQQQIPREQIQPQWFNPSVLSRLQDHKNMSLSSMSNEETQEYSMNPRRQQYEQQMMTGQPDMYWEHLGTAGPMGTNPDYTSHVPTWHMGNPGIPMNHMSHGMNQPRSMMYPGHGMPFLPHVSNPSAPVNYPSHDMNQPRSMVYPGHDMPFLSHVSNPGIPMNYPSYGMNQPRQPMMYPGYGTPPPSNHPSAQPAPGFMIHTSGNHYTNPGQFMYGYNTAGAAGSPSTLPPLLQYEPSLNERLLSASKEGRNEGVQELVSQGADINYSWDLYTVLGAAAAEGHESTVQLLIQLRANVDKKDSLVYGRSPLHLSCEYGHTACCKLLIESGCNIEATDKNGRSPLHLSCENGHTACCELLIESGCNIEATDYMYDMNAMHYACDEGHLNIIQLLLSRGLSLDTPTDGEGRTGRMILREKHLFGDDVNQRRQECLKALEDDHVQSDTSTAAAADTTAVIETVPESIDRTEANDTVLTDDVDKAKVEDEMMTELLRTQIEKEGVVHLSNVKGILIGPPAAGKTVTINRLTGKMVNISTDGGRASTGIEKPIMLHLYHDSEMSSFFIDKMWSPQTLDEQLGMILHCVSQTYMYPHHSCPSPSTTEEDTQPISPMLYQKSDNDTQHTQQHEESSNSDNTASTTSSKVINEREQLDAYFSMLQDFIQQSKWDEVRHHLEIVSNITLFHIIDTGGQPEYFQIFPLLLQGPCFCLIFLNLAYSLDELFQITYRDTPTSHSFIEYQSSYTQLQMIQMILASIHSLNSASNVSKAFLIGTYLDLVKDIDLNKVMKKIEDSLKGTSFYENDFLATYMHKTAGGEMLYRFLYALDNLHGKEDEISELRQILTGIIQELFPSEPLPTSWGVFHLLLRHKYEGEGLCTLDQCVIVGKACGLKTDKDVKLTLKYLHTHFGTILYFEKVKSLESTVVCNPNLIFRPITNLIAGSFGANPSSPRIAKRIRDTGEIPLHVLEKACKLKSKAGKNRIPTKAIIDLLVYHNILTDEIKNSKGEKIQFMSCLLKPCLPTSTSQLISNHERSILFTFHPHKYQPVSLFHVLVAKLLKIPRLLLDDKARYNNKIRFTYGYAEVELESTLKYIKLLVANCNCKEQKRLRSLVQKELNSVVNEIHHMKGTKIGVSFFCPNSVLNKVDPLHTVDLALSIDEKDVIMLCSECESFGQQTMRLNDYHIAWFNNVVADCRPLIASTDSQPPDSKDLDADGNDALPNEQHQNPCSDSTSSVNDPFFTSVLSTRPVDVSKAFEFLQDKSANWDGIARACGFCHNFQEELRQNVALKNDARLYAVLSKWVESAPTQPVTWSKFVEILSSKFLQYNDVVHEVQTYLSTH